MKTSHQINAIGTRCLDSHITRMIFHGLLGLCSQHTGIMHSWWVWSVLQASLFLSDEENEKEEKDDEKPDLKADEEKRGSKDAAFHDSLFPEGT